ncbi:MAG TPA: hypothetical protein DEP57_05215 [Selenomonas sp.]|nr:hypothetical protein [Selenomonas sp.]
MSLYGVESHSTGKGLDEERRSAPCLCCGLEWRGSEVTESGFLSVSQDVNGDALRLAGVMANGRERREEAADGSPCLLSRRFPHSPSKDGGRGARAGL